MATKLSRREMLRLTGTLASGALLAACAPTTAPTAEVVKETVIVTEKETVKETVVVEPTAVPDVVKPVEGNVVVMHFLHEFTEDHVAAFQTDHPGITIEVVDATDLTRFYAMYAAGTPPDMVRVQAPSVPQFLARKLLLDLTPYFETSQLLKMDDLMPANDAYKAESPLQVGSGKIYGCCKDFSPDLTMYVYKPLFEEAGIDLQNGDRSFTYPELWDASKTLFKAEGDRVTIFPFGPEEGWMDRYWMNLLTEVGSSLYTEGYDKMNLTANDQAREIVKWYYDMDAEKYSYSAINPSPGGWTGNDFLAGQLAFLQYGFWFSAMAVNDVTRDNIYMIPAPSWGGVRRDPTITATGMVMTAASQNPDAGWLVFEYYNGGQPSIDRAKSGWGVPALKSQLSMIPQETDFQKQAYKVLQDELALGSSLLQFNPFLGETQVAAAWSKYEEMALTGVIDFDTMLKNIEDETNTAIKDGISAIMG